MKIAKLGTNGIVDMKTTVVGEYHNFKHGVRAKGFSSISVGISTNIMDASISSDPVVLDADNYGLSQVMRNEEYVKDPNGNYVYFIDIDPYERPDDYIIFWDIPNRKYTNVEYSIAGEVEVISKGSNGLVRSGVKYTSPALLLEVSGPSILTWSAVRTDGKKISQKIQYTGNKWDAFKIEIAD